METAHFPLTELGEKDAVAPVGRPDKLSCTVPENPLEPTLTAVYVVLPPCKIVPVLGRPLTAKLGDWANAFVTARSIQVNAAMIDVILNLSDIACLQIMSCRFDSHARRSIGEYIELYNWKRPHSNLADQTPDEAYFATLPAIKSAA
ncbi:transposase [Burkholderia pseudomallei]|uniref:transposase n=1 Tax=Burkholderia pseudomallei TaxID=28450 RepID=UPI00138E199A